MEAPGLRDKIERRFGDQVRDGGFSHGMQSFLVDPDLIVDLCRFLKDDPELRFDFLSDICGVDHHPEENRFEVVYHLYSIGFKSSDQVSGRRSSCRPFGRGRVEHRQLA